MLDILALVLPVFVLIGLGAVAARTGYLPALVGDGLSAFAYAIGLPALLFHTLLAASLPASPPLGYWASYFGGLALVWIAAQWGARRLFGLGSREAVIAGLSVAQANTVMVGIPLLLNAHGPAAAVPIALLIGVNLPITMTLASLLVAGAAGEGRSGAGLARALATHPILVAIVAGLAGNLAGLRLPGALDGLLATLAATAIPCALIGLGMGLVKHGLRDRLGLVGAVTAMKLLAMPGLVYLLATRVFQLEPLYVGAAVVFAAAPVGVNAYIFAARHKTGEALTSSAIAVSTALSPVTIVGWLWLVGIG